MTIKKFIDGKEFQEYLESEDLRIEKDYDNYCQEVKDGFILDYLLEEDQFKSEVK